MASVAVDIIDPALRKLGITNPQANERSDALSALNAMLGSWSARRLTLFAVTRESFPLVVNDSEYTIGSAGDFNTVRPSRITQAYLSDSGQDFPLTARNLKTYNDILDKAANGRPTQIMYLAEYPLGKILFNFQPDKIYTLHLDSLKPITTFSSINTVLSLPPEWQEALTYNLAIRLAPEHDVILVEEIVAIARVSLNNIKDLNAPLPEQVDFHDLPVSRRSFDIFSGQPT